MSGERVQADVAVERARAFVQAIAWGEHVTVWQLLSSEGKQRVVRIAAQRGMDEALVARLAADAGTTSERDQFLTDLVNGLRADLEGNDLDTIEYESDPPTEAGRSRVVMLAPMAPGLSAGLPVGSIDLAWEGGAWLVERLVPRPGFFAP